MKMIAHKNTKGTKFLSCILLSITKGNWKKKIVTMTNIDSDMVDVKEGLILELLKCFFKSICCRSQMFFKWCAA